MNWQITSFKFTQMSHIYLSIYLSALEDILIMINYLLTGRPDARKTHTQPGRPDFFFVAWNSLTYDENSYCIAYFNEFYPTFSQNRVKIGPKFVLSSKITKSKTLGGGILPVLPYKDSTGMCRAKAPRPPPPFFGLGCSTVST